MNILLTVLTHLITFALGFVFGALYAKNKKAIQNIISIIIVLLWSYSVFSDIQNGGSNTPVFLHLFMGSVVGAVHHDFGDFLIKLIRK